MDAIPLVLILVGTAVLLLIAIELGYRVGNSLPESSRKNKEKITSSNSTAILGMLSFILVFSFGIVYERYDSRKALVREEANKIRTAWLRSDFLPEPDRAVASNLIVKYLDLRINVADSKDVNNILQTIKESHKIQNQIWDMAVANARKDMNSDVAALYIEGLNEMFDLQAMRIAVGLQARVPQEIWVFLYLLMLSGMFCVGYEASITGSSKRSMITPIMVVSFSLLIFMIASLDRPDGEIMRVSQQSLVDVKDYIVESGK